MSCVNTGVVTTEDQQSAPRDDKRLSSQLHVCHPPTFSRQVIGSLIIKIMGHLCKMLPTFVVAISSDYIMSCNPIICHSYVFFQECPCPFLNIIRVLHLAMAVSPFPRHHSENACFTKVTVIVSACMSKEGHFTFYNLGQRFTSCLKFIQYGLNCRFLHPTLLHICPILR